MTDESLKEESKLKFQVLGKAYSILSDEEKKKLYDDCGIIDGEDDEFLSSEKDWEAYWRTLFKKITKEDINNFYEKYRNSEEELNDLCKAYEKHKGDMDMIMQEMFSSDLIEDEPRFRDILLDAIEQKKVEKFDKFVKESKKKATKRKANYEKEAKEAEEIRKEMGIDESQDSLRNMILAKRKNENDNFLAQLEKKYANVDSKKKNGKQAKKGKKVEDEEEDEESMEEEEISEDEDDDSSFEENHKPKRAAVRNGSAKKGAKATKVNARKVKRL